MNVDAIPQQQQQYVWPRDLLVVRYRADDGAAREVLAIWCRYVAAHDPTGRQVVAIEIAWDPAGPEPVTPYYVPAHALERVLLPPASVELIRPYLSVASA